MLPMIFGENLFDEFFNNAFGRSVWDADKALYGKHASHIMKTDVHETDDSYKLAIDLPGFKKDEISVDLKDGYMTIRAVKGLDKDETDEKNHRIIRQERYSGVNERSFYVGDVKPEEVKCKYDAGVLTIEIPKRDAKKIESHPTIMIE